MPVISQRRLTKLAFKECARVCADVVNVIFGTLMDEGTSVNYSDFYSFLYGSGSSLNATTSFNSVVEHLTTHLGGRLSYFSGPDVPCEK